MKSILPLSVLLLGITGCSEWPRANNLPEQEGLVPGSSNLGDLYDIEWSSGSEVVDDDGKDGNDDPALTQAIYGVNVLSFGTGAVVNGGLATTGWNATAPVRTFPTEGCDEADLLQGLTDTGFYVGDLDFYVAEINAEIDDSDAVLCGMVEASTANLGWDFLMVDITDCANPTLIQSESEILGYGLGGASGQWSTNVTAGSRYALMMAGYNVPEGEDAPNYRAGVALIHGNADGGSVVCPSLPALDSEGGDDE